MIAINIVDADFADEVNSLREEIDGHAESIGESLSQYKSEVALFGDAGPGQHPSLWLQDAEDRLSNLKAKLNTLLLTPQGKVLIDKEAKEMEEFRVELYAY